MLPRVAAPKTLADQITVMIHSVLDGDYERRDFAYEGKEAEMRRPQGMRHWEQLGYTWV